MVPSAFVFLDLLPLLPNGKVDRQALPSPGESRPELKENFVPPQSEVQRTISDIWKDELHLKNVGVHDNFFDLGGNSLLLMEVHTKLSRIFGEELSVTELFEHPTVSSLARHLVQERDQVAVAGEENRIDGLKSGQSRLKKQAEMRRQGTKDGGPQ